MSVFSRMFAHPVEYHQIERQHLGGGGSPGGMSRNKDQLAERLRLNWASRFPEGRSTGLKDANDELTNLGWLQVS